MWVHKFPFPVYSYVNGQIMRLTLNKGRPFAGEIVQIGETQASDSDLQGRKKQDYYEKLNGKQDLQETIQ